MDLLIKHGTWVIVPVLLTVGYVYLHASGTVYPRLAGRKLGEEVRRKRADASGEDREPADLPE